MAKKDRTPAGIARRNKIIAIAVCLGIVFAAGIILNAEVSIRQGIDGRVREIRMPLYVKAMEFLSRNYEYKRIANEITKGCNTEEQKVLAIFRWTHENIKPTPPGMPIVDDHILNIIIRGYGESDQSQDVFTNLCAYSGIPSFWMWVYTKTRSAWYPVSFVKMGGRWRVFDPYYNTYFMAKSGEIASVEDMMADRSIIESSPMADHLIGETRYKEFFYNLQPINTAGTSRPEQQMPLNRAIFEIKKAVGLEREGLDKAHK